MEVNKGHVLNAFLVICFGWVSYHWVLMKYLLFLLYLRFNHRKPDSTVDFVVL